MDIVVICILFLSTYFRYILICMSVIFYFFIYMACVLFSFHSPGLKIQFSSVAQSCLTVCDPMDISTPGFPVHHQLLELTQTYVHWVGDAIQPSCPLSSPSPPAFNFPSIGVFLISQLFTSGGQSIGASASVLLTNIQDWFPLWLVWSPLQSKGLSRVFSSTTVQEHQFFSAQLSL